MTERFHIAIVGAGPAGLSAAARAAQRDQEASVSSPTHILFESSPLHANTIQRYQKGKLVMAEPGYLDLRSDLPFAQGSREDILEGWAKGIDATDVNVCYDANLTGIKGQQGEFVLSFADGRQFECDNIVLSIGVQGNPRLLAAPGADNPQVQYQLDDPDAYSGEHIIVIGAGDAAIENALALASNNQVTLLNRGSEFSRAKEGNLQAILNAINDPGITLDCLYSATVDHIDLVEGAVIGQDATMHVVINTASGAVDILSHRIIARLGSTPPRAFVESAGIVFSGPDIDALPELDQHYRTNIPGLHVIGALAGNPLIKHAMNQGYDVIEFINGHDIKPADHALLEMRFAALPFRLSVDEQVERLKQLIPMLAELNTLQFRELLIDSAMIASYPAGAEFKQAQKQLAEAAKAVPDKSLHERLTTVQREGDTIHEAGQYGTSFYTILAGEVHTERTLDDGRVVKSTLQRGEFFGEVGLLSGHPRQERAVAGSGCIVMETPRRTMLKLIGSNVEIKSGIDNVFTVRELQRHLAPLATKRELKGIAASLEVRHCRAGETLYEEGAEENCLYLIKSGGFTLSRQLDGQNQFIAQVRAGKMIGQLALMGDPTRRETAVATVESTAVVVSHDAFKRLMQLPDAPVSSLQNRVTDVLTEHTHMEVRKEAGSAMDFLMDNGLGEATDTLIIDESLCIGCDNCEKACAETHGGVSMLNRTLGPTFGNIHIPTACRHCEQPHCMKDCPPNALHRAPTGEVFIDQTCIGCGNCQTNCPYGVIRMVETAPKRPSLLSWMLFNRGQGPGEAKNARKKSGVPGGPETPKKARKCDACMSLPSGPACVSNCPTGAALRLAPGDFVRLVEEKAR